MADLREEVEDIEGEELEAWLQAVAKDWRSAEMGDLDRALCAYGEKLTRTPAAMNEGDVVGLRELGLDDVAIHDAIQVVSYFNYINRIADAVRVDLEEDMPPYSEE